MDKQVKTQENVDEFISYFNETEEIPTVNKDDSKYLNYLIITRLLKEIRSLEELNTKESVYLLIDEFIKNDKTYALNTLLKDFFDKFKQFYDQLYHDICYSEMGYIRNEVYGEAYYSIDKDFILNKRYKNEYKECSGMYEALASIVPTEYIDLVFEDFLYTINNNIGFDYHRKRIGDNVHYQISYSSRIINIVNNYLDILMKEFGEKDISNEPVLQDYIKGKLINKNVFVQEEKVKELKKIGK